MKTTLILIIVSLFSALQLHGQDSLMNAFNKYGFHCATDADGYVTSYVFKRERGDIDEIIYLYQTTGSDGFVEFAPPQVQITFHKVEKVLNDTTVPRMTFINHTIQSTCLQQMLDATNAMHMKHRMMPVNTHMEKVNFINYLHLFYALCAEQFFRDYGILERVDCHLSDLSDKEADQFIFSGNNCSIHRRLIIKALAGNTDTRDYYEYLKPHLYAKKDVSSTYGKMYSLWFQIGKKLGIETTAK